MLKKDVVILLGVAVLTLLGALVLPRLSIFARASFEPEQITRDIMRDHGASTPASDSACHTLLQQLRPLYEQLECRTHEKTVSRLTEEINSTVHHYRARPTSGWQIGDLGLTRLYRNPNQSEPQAARQLLFILVSNNLVVTGYND